MKPSFEFRRATCDQIHRGIPTFAAGTPYSYGLLSEEEQTRAALSSDQCIIHDEWFFVRGPQGE